MTEHRIYEQLAALAAPVVKHYETDLTHHDRNALECSSAGDIAFWSPRECGTHFIWADLKSWRAMKRFESAAERAHSINWFDACVDSASGYPPRKWYRLDFECRGHGTVREVTESEARAFMVTLQRRDGMPTAWVESAYSQTA